MSDDGTKKVDWDSILRNTSLSQETRDLLEKYPLPTNFSLINRSLLCNVPYSLHFTQIFPIIKAGLLSIDRFQREEIISKLELNFSLLDDEIVDLYLTDDVIQKLDPKDRKNLHLSIRCYEKSKPEL